MTKKAQHEANMAAKAAAKNAAAAAELARIHANPIYGAVAPQKAETQDRAAAAVEARLREIAGKLVGTDLRITAPRASTRVHGWGSEYKQVQNFHYLAGRITVCRKKINWQDNSEFVESISEKGIAYLVEQAREEAGLSFDSYVAKLTSKVGECDAAEVTGWLWNHSYLAVSKGGKAEVWKTQQIINVSVLGKLFNQWPTRLMKGAK
jgi:hypothetical protein